MIIISPSLDALKGRDKFAFPANDGPYWVSDGARDHSALYLAYAELALLGSVFGSAELASLGSVFLRRQRQRRVRSERTVEGAARNRGTQHAPPPPEPRSG